MKNETENTYIYPNRQDAIHGVHIPPWLLTLRLPAEETLTWAVLARCAGSKKRLQGYSIRRIAAVSGLSEARVRKAIHALVAKGLIERDVSKNGVRPTYAFLRHPRAMTSTGDYLKWAVYQRALDLADSDNDWRQW